MEQVGGIDLAADCQVAGGTGVRGNGGSMALSLFTSDGVCLGEIGAEGSATYAPRVSIDQYAAPLAQVLR